MLVVVGGQARKVGKTSVVEGILRGTPELGWTAIKLSHHGCEEQSAPVVFEWGKTSGDTGRYLAAGAKKAAMARVMPGRVIEAIPDLLGLSGSGRNVIVESVGVMEFVKPDLFLLVVDPANADFKESARRFASRASAVLAHGGELPEFLADAVVFRIRSGEFVTAEVLEFVRGRLGLTHG
jgi:hypothetical protein